MVAATRVAQPPATSRCSGRRSAAGPAHGQEDAAADQQREAAVGEVAGDAVEGARGAAAECGLVRQVDDGLRGRAHREGERARDRMAVLRDGLPGDGVRAVAEPAAQRDRGGGPGALARGMAGRARGHVRPGRVEHPQRVGGQQHTLGEGEHHLLRRGLHHGAVRRDGTDQRGVRGHGRGRGQQHREERAARGDEGRQPAARATSCTPDRTAARTPDRTAPAPRTAPRDAPPRTEGADTAADAGSLTGTYNRLFILCSAPRVIRGRPHGHGDRDRRGRGVGEVEP